MYCVRCNRETDSICMDRCSYFADVLSKRKEDEMEKSKTMGMIKLLPALQYAFPEIRQAFYMVDKDTLEEYVIVQYEAKDSVCRYDFKVCVTCDSISAMYDDVWKECKRRFG